jgi:hypothetical protein
MRHLPMPAFARISAKKPHLALSHRRKSKSIAFSEPVGGGSRQNPGLVFNL